MNQKPYFKAKATPKSPIAKNNYQSGLQPSPHNIQKSSKSQPPNEPSVLMDMIHNLEKEVVQPIAFYCQTFNYQQMSRCIIHNNVITLYCKNESKPLCVSCSYLSQIHKTHKVVPLDKAEKEVKVDLNSIRPEVKKAIKAVDEMILLNSKNNIKGEEKYPKIIEKITKFYTELEEMLKVAKTKHLQIINQIWKQAKYINKSTEKQLQEIKKFAQKYAEKIQEDKQIDLHTIVNQRNIAQSLIKIEPLLKKQLIKDEYIQLQNDLSSFPEIKQNIEKQLSLVYKSPFNNSKKPQVSKYKSPRLSPKITPKTPKVTTQTQNESFSLVDTPSTPTERSLTRNRHSKQNLLKIKATTERIREMEEESARKKNQLLLSKILARPESKQEEGQPGKFKQHRVKQIKNKT